MNLHRTRKRLLASESSGNILGDGMAYRDRAYEYNRVKPYWQ
jgi:hypothetical protein